MKKTLALVLAFALVFSTMTFAFADDAAISADAKVCADLGMLVGDGNGVTAAYTATAPTRIQSAVMFLRLKGLYDEAIKFAGTDNFADGNIAWAEGKNLLAYLKANPQLGWQGDGKNFNPNNPITAKEYYKVMLQALGYVQSSATVAGGDFSWDNVIDFAATKGLTKAATVASFTINDVAVATVEALKGNMKEGGKSLAAALVEAGKVDKAAAVAAGVYTETPAAPTVAVDSATAIGNSVVEVAYEDDVDAAAAGSLTNYAIDGLEIKSVTVTGTDTVRLETAAQTSGKLYTLTVGGKAVKFTGVPKSSSAPAISKTESSDVEEVVVTFTKNMDFATATDVANYTIAGVEVVSASVDGKEVTLTTKGLAARKQYEVKVKNVKSIDGALLKSDSDTFYTKLDTTAPHIDNVVAETDQRVVVTFDEKVTKETAENVANYTIKTVSGDVVLPVQSAVLTASGDNKELEVTLTTDVQTANKKYELAVLNVADQTKAANAIKKAAKFDFFGKKEDTKAPVFARVEAVGRNLVKVSFTDDSKIDPGSALDANNYTLKKGSTEYAVEKVEELDNVNGSYKALLTVEDMPTGSYTLTAENVADEFTNEMDSTDRSFAVNLNTYSAATVTLVDWADVTASPVVNDGNHLTLTFDKPLNEDAAEDISNYSLDGDVGNPISATYSEDETVTPAKYQVVLETNDLVKGYDYDITVKGVTDLAGNVLDLFLEDTPTQGATVGVDAAWDTASVELEDAYAVNTNVVALSFDDEVADTCLGSAQVVLRPQGATNAAGDLTLTAKDQKDDGAVVEFSDYTDESTNVALDPTVTYFVYDITGTLTDLAGNAFVAPSDLNEYLVQGTDEKPEHATVDTIEQLDGKTFKVTFSENVHYNGTPIPGWTLDSDSTDDDSTVRFQISSGILSENTAEYQINMSSYFTDLHGVAVYDDNDEDGDVTAKTSLFVENEDGDSPYIVSVTAVDRTHIEVVYNERVKCANWNAVYAVKNADSDVSKTEITPASVSLGSDLETVTITMNSANALQSIYDYELVIKAATVKDIADNTSEEEVNDTFSFNGTDLTHLGF